MRRLRLIKVVVPEIVAYFGATPEARGQTTDVQDVVTGLIRHMSAVHIAAQNSTGTK